MRSQNNARVFALACLLVVVSAAPASLTLLHAGSYTVDLRPGRGAAAISCSTGFPSRPRSRLFLSVSA